ncbi:MAG TPA: hypothetical protein VK528_05590 [Flavobacterium sp.]|nr:hypothetical protein [Flavobacterium sp.]
MKKLACLVVLLLLSANNYAQKKLSSDYSYSVSQPYKTFDASNKYYLSKGNEAIAVKIKGADVMIQKFDITKPAMVKEKLQENALAKNVGLEDVLKIDDRFYILYNSWDGDKDTEQLFSQEIDFDKGEITGQPVLLLTVKGHIVKGAPKQSAPSGFGGFGAFGAAFGASNKFDFYTSFDKKTLLAKYRRKPEVKNDKKSFDIIGLATFDAGLTKVTAKEYTMPYTERRMDNLDYQVDNRGNMYMLNKIYHDDSGDDKKKKKDTIANYHIELFTIRKGNDKMKITNVENGNKFITNLAIFDSPNSDYVMAGGFYSNGKGKNALVNSDGLITFKIKDDGTIFDNFTYDIPLETINAYEKNKTKRRNERKEEKGEGAKMTNLRMSTLSVGPDGSMLLVGEQTWIEVRTYTSSSGTRTKIYYHYDDLLAAKLTSSGELAWMNKIPKRQVGDDQPGGLSYKFYRSGDNIFLVYMDNVKNIDLPLDKDAAEHRDGSGGYITAARISTNDGVLTRGSILNSREVEDFKLKQFSKDRVLGIDDNTFVFEAYKKGKEDVLVKVILK